MSSNMTLAPLLRVKYLVLNNKKLGKKMHRGLTFEPPSTPKTPLASERSRSKDRLSATLMLTALLCAVAGGSYSLKHFGPDSSSSESSTSSSLSTDLLSAGTEGDLSSLLDETSTFDFASAPLFPELTLTTPKLLPELKTDTVVEPPISEPVEPSISSETDSSNTATPFNYTFLVAIFGTLTALGALLGGVGFIVRQVTAAREAKSMRRSALGFLSRRYQAAQSRHKLIEQEYGAYLLDLQEIFKRPALSDVSIKETADFVELYVTLGPSSESLIESESFLDEAIIESYEARVSHLSRAWRAASDKARKLGLGIFTPEEVKKVRRASDLLQMALDPGSSEFERAQAYQQVRKLIEGLLVIPEATTLRIESRKSQPIRA